MLKSKFDNFLIFKYYKDIKNAEYLIFEKLTETSCKKVSTGNRSETEFTTFFLHKFSVSKTFSLWVYFYSILTVSKSASNFVF